MRDFMDKRRYPEDFKDKLDNKISMDEFEGIDQNPEIYKLVNKLKSHYNDIELENEKLKMSLDETKEFKSRYLELFESNPIAYITIKEDGTILGVNNSAVSMLGLNRDNIIGYNFNDCISPDHQDIYKDTLKKASAAIKSQNCSVKIMDDLENIIYTDINVLPHYDGDGNLKEFSVALIDISHHKTVENDLLLKYQDLKEKMEVYVPKNF